MLGSRLGEVASAYGKDATELGDLLRRDGSLRLDSVGRLYVEEEVAIPPAPASSAGRDLGIVDGGLVPDSQTFTLHSRPGALRTIYLDFDGATLVGTAWNSNGNTITAPPFDIDGVPGTFSSTELQRIQYIWQRVAEDYAPFDVDVTTQVPPADALTRTTTSDTVYGTTALITTAAGVYSCSCGGVAYLGIFDLEDSTNFYKPALVFYDMLGPGDEKYIAEAISHEVGHNGGLDHDGTSTTGYYQGQGTWAPIMGVGYYKSLVQWSKGEYSGANNREDDLAVMQGNGLTLRVDDYGNSPSTATPLTGGVTSGTVTTYTLAGVISSASDVDVVSFSAGSVGVVTATLVPATRSPNLDAVVALLGSGGGVLATANPATSLGASLTFTLPAPGTYYVSVRGTGYLDPLTTGYSSYGSLGNYQLTLATPAGGGGGGGGGSPPTAVAVATTPTSGTAPLTVGFSGAGSTDSDGTITSYSWAFGNGQTGTGVTTTHVFTTPGTFSVTLRTTDNSALSTTSAPVVVVVSGGTVRLAGLTLTTIVTQASRNRLRAQARAVVTVVDGTGGVVSGAVVSVRWSGLVTGTTSGTTGAAGTVTFLSSTTLNQGTFTLTVTGITKTGFTYNPAANLVAATGSVAW